MGGVIEEHVLHYLAREGLTQAERTEGAAELTDVVRTHLK
jgi:hypothetical protein